MTKKREYKFTAKDYIRFCFYSWPILLICILCGSCVAAYSYLKQESSFGLSMVLLIHKEGANISGSTSPYVQIPMILSSSKSYEKIGLSPDKLGFNGITAREIEAGVISFEGESADSDSVKASMRMIAENAEAVINATYANEEHGYEVTILKEPGDEVIEYNTKKEKLSSAVLIIIFSVFAAIGIDFIIFNKKAKVN